jgi:PAS domain S-box-containing protein
MSDLPVDPHFCHDPNELRVKAQTLMQQGNAPTSLGDGLSPDALAVLFKLASSPDSASDGLKLLHELQTHQIELDLQREQNKVNELETEAELARYKALFEFAPAGYLIINRDGRILESNRAGADLLGVPCNDLNGCLFEDHLAPASRPVFSWKLKKLFNGTGRETCAVHTIDNNDDCIDSSKGKVHALRVSATLAPDGEVVLANISELESPQPK